MLILNRKVGQSIIISADIKVIITDVKEDHRGDTIISLGIDAPNYVAVNREEIYKKKVDKLDRLFKKKDA